MLICILAVLGVLAPCAVIASEMPWMAALPLALLAAAYAGWAAWREVRSSSRELVVRADAVGSICDGHAMHGLCVRWRGPLAFLRWHDDDGHVQRLVFWPDTLPRARRRELRLSAPMPGTAPPAASMAP